MGYQWGEQERGVDKRPNQIYGKPEGFEANCKRIETHKVRPFLEDTSSGKVSVAFLARAPYKFTEKLFEEDAQTRRETLKSMSRWLIAHPKNKVSQSELDCIQILTQLLSDKDVVIREHAALVLSLLASVMEGVDKMLQVGTIKQLLVVMQDVASLKARSYAHKCLQLIGNLPEGSQAMVDAGGTAMLVAVCKHSPTADAVLSLKCCLQCMQGLSDALECRAIGAMASCVSSEDPAILQHALKNITYLTLSQAAKLEAIAEGCMPRIVQLVLHDIALVRASAIAAVASIAVAVEGKKLAFELGAVKSLVGLLSDENFSVVLLSVRCLGVLAEYKRELLSTPNEDQYRSSFDDALPMLSKLRQSQDEVLARSARNTEDLILWRP